MFATIRSISFWMFVAGIIILSIAWGEISTSPPIHAIIAVTVTVVILLAVIITHVVRTSQ